MGLAEYQRQEQQALLEDLKNRGVILKVSRCGVLTSIEVYEGTLALGCSRQDAELAAISADYARRNIGTLVVRA